MIYDTPITGTPEEVRQRLKTELNGNDSYRAVIEQRNREKISVNISRSAGGAEEGGYESTNISAPVVSRDHFRFSIHPQDFLSELAKFFGAEDKITGYPTFDDEVVVKTNDVDRFRKVFADESVRAVFQELSGYEFSLTKRDGQAMLELTIQHAVEDSDEMWPIYHAFGLVLDAVTVSNAL